MAQNEVRININARDQASGVMSKVTKNFKFGAAAIGVALAGIGVASVKMAVDMVQEGAISREEALLRVDAEDVGQLLVPQFMEDVESPQVRHRLLAQGSGASPGAASGRVYFDADRAVQAAAVRCPRLAIDGYSHVLPQGGQRCGGVVRGRGLRVRDADDLRRRRVGGAEGANSYPFLGQAIADGVVVVDRLIARGAVG